MPFTMLANPAPMSTESILADALTRGVVWRNVGAAGQENAAAVSEALGVEWSPGTPIVVNLGGGVDSSAILFRLYKLGIRPDCIIFSWVGRPEHSDEKPATIRHLAVMAAWCQEVGFPQISVINYVHRQDRYRALSEKALRNRIHNSPVMGGGHSCSAAFKGEIIDRWLERERYAEHVKAGGQVVRIIGFEANESERVERMERMFKRPDGKLALTVVETKPVKPCNAGSFAVTNRTATHWRWSFPMVTWGMTREVAEQECLETIGYVPVKSACYHCGFSKEHEWLALARELPFYASRLVDEECLVSAGGKLKVDGRGFLGKPTKGGQRRKNKPADGLFEYQPEIDRWVSIPRSGKVTDLYRRHGLLEAIESARPTFLTLGVPADDEWQTIMDLDDRAERARLERVTRETWAQLSLCA